MGISSCRIVEVDVAESGNDIQEPNGCCDSREIKSAQEQAEEDSGEVFQKVVVGLFIFKIKYIVWHKFIINLIILLSGLC